MTFFARVPRQDRSNPPAQGGLYRTVTFFLGGSAESGYNLPGSVFDKEFRCTFELLNSIPSASNPSISVTDEFFAFNTGEPYHDRAHIFDRDGCIVHGPRSTGKGLLVLERPRDRGPSGYHRADWSLARAACIG
jgi:MCRA family